jgi:hypothetical protein
MDLLKTARTPRKALTPEEKTAHDERYRVDPTIFGNILTEIATAFAAIMDLNTALAKAGQGARLGFTNPNNPAGPLIPFTRSHLRSARTQFQTTLKELKTYFRVSIRGHRKPAVPGDFKATYTPVFAAEALREFFSRQGGAGFGVLNPLGADATAQGGALMDQLALVKQGYLLRNTCTMLFYVYARQNQLQAENAQLTRSDDLMNAVFGNDIPAAFWSIDTLVGQTRDDAGNLVNKYNKTKVRMEDAVAQGLISAPMNSYQVVETKFPFANGEGFDPQNKTGQNPSGNFNTYFYQNIASLNQFNRTALRADPALAATADFIDQAATRQAMLAEHDIVKQTSAQWTELLAPGRKVARDARAKAKPKKPKAEKKKAAPIILA